MAEVTYNDGDANRDGEKPIEWMGASFDVLKSVREDDVQDQICCALDLAQHSKHAAYAQPLDNDLKDINEVVVLADCSILHGAYTTRSADVVYVLDVFMTHPETENEPPREDHDARLRSRFDQAKGHYEENHANKL